MIAALIGCVVIVLVFMTALTEDTGRDLRALGPIKVPLLNDAVLYDGAICCYDANGELQPGADTAGLKYAGIYRRSKLDNADDGLEAEVDPLRPYKATIAAATQADLGKPVFLLDDNTVGLTSDNLVWGGNILLIESATEVFILPPRAVYLKLADVEFTAEEVADAAAATSTDGLAAGLTFSATVAQAEAEALAAEVELIGDDVRAAIGTLDDVVTALKSLGLLTDPA